jgi:CelD/BcsL family acetyltransferase involved in cellulose biosynthesis
MARLMKFEATATFTHPDWLRAIAAQVPGAELFQLPQTGLPKLTAALRPARLPFKHYETFVTPLSPQGVPAVAPGIVPPVADLLDGLEAPVLFRSLPIAHPVTEALMKHATHVSVLKRWERAGLDVSGSYETWLSENFDHKRRKELKRLRARLGEAGLLEVKTLSKGDALDGFINGLLQLESAGWKGGQGTALAQSPELTKALWDGLKAMHARGRVRFWEMSIDGKPIASLFALIDGSEACLGKIAYDEAFAKFSPGVMIILEATQALFAEDGILVADSNAIPDHPMINRIWRDRIECADVLVAGSVVPASVFNGLSLFHQARNSIRGALKRLFVSVTRKKVS